MFKEYGNVVYIIKKPQAFRQAISWQLAGNQLAFSWQSASMHCRAEQNTLCCTEGKKLFCSNHYKIMKRSRDTFLMQTQTNLY